jgi:N-acetylmuramoyl-L-alanine amidase
MRQINKIIVHCSATREGENYTVDTIRSWHVDGRGWSDISILTYMEKYTKVEI